MFEPALRSWQRGERLALTVTTMVMAAAVVHANGDPTLPPASIAPPTDRAGEIQDADRDNPMTVRAIFVSKSRRVALIGDRRVQVGDRIGPSRVARIEADRVEIDRDGKRITLELLKREVKKPSKPAPDERMPQ